MNRLIVINDVGAANLILSKFEKKYNHDILATGPAEDLLKYYNIDNNLKFSEAIQKIENNHYSQIITGTGSGNKEHYFRIIARIKGIPVAAVIDHWVNYKERFDKLGEFVLPNEIWVTDKHALNLAAETFKENVPIRLMENKYLEKLKKTYEEGPKDKYVYFKNLDNNDDKVINYLQKSYIGSKLIIKEHPRVKMENIFEYISKAKAVIGGDTYAVWAAAEIGIPSYSIYKNTKLPNKNIKYYKELINENSLRNIR